MARITADDCLAKIPNRYDLVLAATKRAHQLAQGIKDPLIHNSTNKPAVLALREIAAGLITEESLLGIEAELNNQPIELDEDAMVRKFAEHDRAQEEERVRQEEMQREMIARQGRRAEQDRQNERLAAEQDAANQVEENTANEDEEDAVTDDESAATLSADALLDAEVAEQFTTEFEESDDLSSGDFEESEKE